jgi:hypothetical protein
VGWGKREVGGGERETGEAGMRDRERGGNSVCERVPMCRWRQALTMEGQLGMSPPRIAPSSSLPSLSFAVAPTAFTLSYAVMRMIGEIRDAKRARLVAVRRGRGRRCEEMAPVMLGWHG